MSGNERKSPVVVVSAEHLLRDGIVENLSREMRPPVLIKERIPALEKIFNPEPEGYYAYVPPVGSTLKDRLIGPHGGMKDFISPSGARTGFASPLRLTAEQAEIVLIRRSTALRKNPVDTPTPPNRPTSRWASNSPRESRWEGFGGRGPR